MGRLLVLFVIVGGVYIGSEAVGAARRLLAPPDDPAARTATATRTMRKPTNVETPLRRVAASNPVEPPSESDAAGVREVAEAEPESDPSKSDAAVVWEIDSSKSGAAVVREIDPSKSDAAVVWDTDHFKIDAAAGPSLSKIDAAVGSETGLSKSDAAVGEFAETIGLGTDPSKSDAAVMREVAEAIGVWSGPSRLDTRQIADKVFTLTNTARAQHGLPALRRVGAIDQIALGHSTNMARSGTLSHVDSRGNDANARAVLSGYPCRKPQPGGAIKYGLAENIAKHPRVISWKKKGAGAWRATGWHSETELASRLVERWMDSPGHRANILSPRIDRIGIGIAVKDETSFTKPNEWVMATQNFC